MDTGYIDKVLLHTTIIEEIENGAAWMAFKLKPSDVLAHNDLRFFSSATDAERFCTSVSEPFFNGQGEYIDPEEIWLYAPANDVVRRFVLSGNEQLRNPLDTDLALEALKNAGATPFVTSGREPAYRDDLVNGYIVPVQWEQQIIPLQEIERYHLVGHRYPQGMVYEIGHELQRMGEFESLDEANKALDQALMGSSTTRLEEYLIVGQYRGRPLQLDMEGSPVSISGITVAVVTIAGNSPEDNHTYRYPSLDKPVTIHQLLFARYDAGAAHLELLDERLQTAFPQKYSYQIAPFHFDNGASLHIQQLKTMEQQQVNGTEASAPEENNLEKLKENLKYRGFDNIFDKVLQEKIEDKVPEFTLQHSTDQVIYDLHFNKAKEENKWYFNKMDATLLPTEQRPDGYTHTFYDNQGVTAKEAVNLLEGRAVLKRLNIYEKESEAPDAKYKWTDKTYNAWLQIDYNSDKKENNQYELKRYSELKKKENQQDPDELRFDLKQVLRDNGIRDVDNPMRADQLMQSIGKGNLTKTIQYKNEKENTVYVLADPKFKSIMLFDQDKKRMFLSKKKGEHQDGPAQEGEGKSTDAAITAKPETGATDKTVKQTDKEQQADKKNARKGMRKGM